jgi:hypothetical protein
VPLRIALGHPMGQLLANVPGTDHDEIVAGREPRCHGVEESVEMFHPMPFPRLLCQPAPVSDLWIAPDVMGSAMARRDVGRDARDDDPLTLGAQDDRLPGVQPDEAGGSRRARPWM